MNVYGITHNGIHTDISTSKEATERYATLNGYNQISVRYNNRWNAQIIAIKDGKKWRKV